jgi:glycosyltransferase involved in cell wall biosynthesis/O-antigen/teichoic acid export membrane protein
VHVLVLTDRDWTHPQAGGTGTVLFGLTSRWLAAGHRVTVVAGEYPGAERVSRPAPGLEIHRRGSRLTVFGWAAWRTLRGVGRDADACLEVCNGIAFCTPLWWWLRSMSRALLVFHVHRRHYVAELGRKGAVAAFFAERLPLVALYRREPVLTISQASLEELEELGIARERLRLVRLGVEPGALAPRPEAPEPSLVYLGRLKQYKRIEVLLDVVERVPGGHLHLAGEGDHRPVLEAEIAGRGLEDRVTLHGHVSEEDKARLLGEAWVALTASSAEGWCLTVMEAGLCETPTAALAVGGLREAIRHGETGMLADTPQELAEAVTELVERPERRRAMGEAAREWATSHTWDGTAHATMEAMQEVAAVPRAGLLRSLRASDSAKAAGLAAATLVNNAFQLVFVVVFTRLLGQAGYATLAAGVSAFLILLVAGQSVQVAAAREAALDRLGHRDVLRATLRRWEHQLFLALAVVTGLAVAIREPFAALIGIPEAPWVAAAIPPTGVLWMILSLQRGALQGLQAYRAVAGSIVFEAIGRLVCAIALYAAGLGVLGAFLGATLAFALVSAGLEVVLHRKLGPVELSQTTRTLRSLIGDGWIGIVGLFLIAALQNVDVIVAKRELSAEAAGAYAAAAVAAKAVVWVAIGIGLHLLPEATRRAAAGLDPRPVLLRALAILSVVAIPGLLIFTFAGELVLRLAFGPEYTQASGALPVLGLAMALIACAYLAVQYMVALGEVRFLWVLGVVAIIEPFLLSRPDLGIVGFATLVFGIQAVAASAALALGLRARWVPSRAQAPA